MRFLGVRLRLDFDDTGVSTVMLFLGVVSTLMLFLGVVSAFMLFMALGSTVVMPHLDLGTAFMLLNFLGVDSAFILFLCSLPGQDFDRIVDLQGISTF